MIKNYKTILLSSNKIIKLIYQAKKYNVKNIIITNDSFKKHVI